MDRDALLALFKTLVEPHDGIAVKGKKMPYTSVNGNMFAFLAPEDEMCFRYAEPRRKELAEAWGAGLVKQYNATMHGYVAIPEAELSNAKALFDECVAFAQDLPPKPTKNVSRKTQ